MDAEPPRLVLAFSSLGGAVVYGTFHLATTLWAGQPVERIHVWRALANVTAAMIVGVITAFLLGPAVSGYVPVESLKDPHVVGFAMGAGAWEVAPFLFGWLRKRAQQIAREKSQ